MSTALRLIIASLLLMVAIPAWSATAVIVYTCQMDEEASEDDIHAVSDDWIKAARGMPGGKNVEAYTMFPVAASMGEDDFLFIVTAPSLGEWGAFMDQYTGSEASEEDRKYADLASCSDSALWESFKAGPE
jgi:hypothetical protein